MGLARICAGGAQQWASLPLTYRNCPLENEGSRRFSHGLATLQSSLVRHAG